MTGVQTFQEGQQEVNDISRDGVLIVDAIAVVIGVAKAGVYGLIDENDAACSIPAVGVVLEGQVLVDVVRAVLVEHCQLGRATGAT